VSKEGLVRLNLKTDTLQATVMPELGGKVSSLQYKGRELLQGPLRPYALRSAEMGFEESDASGFDECLPTVAECAIAGAGRVPDHGEIWRLECEWEQKGERELRLSATGRVLPLRMERSLTLEESALRIEYRVENVGEAETPYVWSAHPLFAVEEGDRIVLPERVKRVTVEGSAGARLGAKGAVVEWPMAQTAGGCETDLSRAGKVSDGVGDKVYVAGEVEGWAAIERRRAGVRVEVQFDASLTPYLGLWLCYGGWPEGQAASQQCVALEPCTAPADSLADALKKCWARVLAPGQTAKWQMTIAVSEIS
jgi:galactose mutarotase-like enzyme